MPCLFAGCTDGWYVRAGPELDYAKFASSFCSSHSFSRIPCSLVLRGSHSQSENMRILGRRVLRNAAGGQGIEGVKSFVVNFDPQVRRERPNLLSALIHALEMQERAMAFGDRILRKTGSLKMSVGVGGEDEGGQVLFPCPFEKKRESVVRFGHAVEIEPVPVNPHASSGDSLNQRGLAMSSNWIPSLAKGG